MCSCDTLDDSTHAAHDGTVIKLRRGTTTVTVDEQRGGRVASFVVHGQERLVTAGDDAHPFLWGSFPMVPWAGRMRNGRFRHGGIEHQLPTNLSPHAIHGTVADATWTVDHARPHEVRMSTPLGPTWPWTGRAIQVITLEGNGRNEGALRCWLSIESEGDCFPAQVGWHPWFSDNGTPPRLRFAAQAMYVRDRDGIPSGDTAFPGPHPWDDCFAGVIDSPRLHYSDGVELELSSDCDHWVVYEPDNAVCVEPQSGPPNGFTLQPQTVEPGRPLSRTFVISFT